MLEILKSVDINLFYFFNRTLPHQGILMLFFQTVDYATYLVWLLLPIIYLASKNKKGQIFGKLALFNLALAIFVEGVLKLLIRRPRPFFTQEGVQLLTIIFPNFSFPSGHATISFSLAALSWLHFPKTKVAYGILLLATLGGISRVYLGAHYPFDIFGGLFIGIICAYLTYKYLVKVPR